jgi:hypothetical protein
MTPAHDHPPAACNEGLYGAGASRQGVSAPIRVDQQDGHHRIGRFRLGTATSPCLPGYRARLSPHGLSGRFVLSMCCGQPHTNTER